MRFLLPFIACLMLVVTSLTSIAHAIEGPENRVSAVELATCHTPGDADEVPADADKGYPHHHSVCHGHDLAGPTKAPSAPGVMREARTVRPAPALALIAQAADTPHRPPIA